MPISLKEAGASPPSFSAGQVTVAVTVAASHIGFTTLQEKGTATLACSPTDEGEQT